MYRGLEGLLDEKATVDEKKNEKNRHGVKGLDSLLLTKHSTLFPVLCDHSSVKNNGAYSSGLQGIL